ncbi:hypothetical protein ACWDTI_02700, partial [Gordonia sp. NPDC003424]
LPNGKTDGEPRDASDREGRPGAGAGASLAGRKPLDKFRNAFGIAPLAVRRFVGPPMHTDRMARDRTKSLVRVKFGPDVSSQVVQEFKRTRGLPKSPVMHPTQGLVAKRVETFKQTVNAIVPTGTTVSIWPAIDMATTLAYVAPERFGPDSGMNYTLERGANIASAKTLCRDDGAFDIVVDGNWFFNGRDDSEEDITEKSRILAHLAAHEPQHIVLAIAGLDVGQVTDAARGASATANDLVPGIAEAVNEYQCELAANRIVVSAFPHDAASTADDLATFRESLATSVELADSDRYAACVTVLTAAKELVKGVAYAAAYRLHDGRDDRSVPNPLPEQWDRYMLQLWPDLLEMFDAIPAAGEPIDATVLGSAVYEMTERVLNWLEEIGVTYLVEVEGDEWRRSCWWDIASPT